MAGSAVSGTGAVIVEIVILAMIAAFLGLRLYSVLGRRAEHEEEVVPRQLDRRGNAPGDARADSRSPAPALAGAPAAAPRIDGLVPAVERGVREIAAADPRFDLLGFLHGAKGAYAMILEAFWKGDRETLRELCDDDVYAGFAAAIDAREAAGETLENRLIRIEDATVKAASLENGVARLSVLFVADIAAVTRDRDGNLVAGSLNDAVESRDVWTFKRAVTASTPNWVLDETDEG